VCVKKEGKAAIGPVEKKLAEKKRGGGVDGERIFTERK